MDGVGKDTHNDFIKISRDFGLKVLLGVHPAAQHIRDGVVLAGDVHHAEIDFGERFVPSGDTCYRSGESVNALGVPIP